MNIFATIITAFTTTLLASIPCTARAENAGEKFATILQRRLDEVNPDPIPNPGGGTELEKRWRMDEPQILYDSATDIFTLNFLTASTLNDPSDGMQYAFFDVNCQDDGTFAQNNIEEYRVANTNPAITNPETGGPPVLTMLGPNSTPQMRFKVNHALLAADQNLFQMSP